MAQKKTWKYVVEVVLSFADRHTKSEVKEWVEEAAKNRIGAIKSKVRSVDLE